MDNGFFKWVWRFNSLAIAAGVILILGIILWEITNDWQRNLRTSAIVNIDTEDTLIEETLTLSAVRLDRNTGLVQFDLVRNQTYDIGGYNSSNSSKSAYNSIVNKGYMDPVTGVTRWLLNTFDGLIIWQKNAVTESDPPEVDSTSADAETSRTVAMFYRVVTSDTSGDKRLSRFDKGIVYMSDSDGRNLTPLLTDVDRVVDAFTQDNQTHILHVQQDGSEMLAFVSLTERKIIRTLPMPTPKMSTR